MKIIDAGSEPMSNEDVLEFIKAKTQQYKDDDAQDKADGIPIKPRPKNLLIALEKHKRELESDKYPYTRNPKAYDGSYDSMKEFDDLVMKWIILPCTAKYTNKGFKAEEIDAKLGKDHEMKSLTEMELLQIHNHAPQCAEMLQPMIENWEERFSPEEMDLIVKAIMQAYRKEEPGAGGEDAVDGLEQGSR